jgi:hypothetical protein
VIVSIPPFASQYLLLIPFWFALLLSTTLTIEVVPLVVEIQW